jgi:hypothetical protein
MPVTLISYYDKVGNATFHPNNNSISFTMPFNYDLKRLNDPKNNVFIHEEVHVPKPSIFTKPGSYVAYANDKDVTNSIMVDGNNQSKDVVHYMIAKPLALQIADAYNKSHPNDPNGMMTFSLLPSTNGSKSMAGNMNMSMPTGVGGAK